MHMRHARCTHNCIFHHTTVATRTSVQMSSTVFLPPSATHTIRPPLAPTQPSITATTTTTTATRTLVHSAEGPPAEHACDHQLRAAAVEHTHKGVLHSVMCVSVCVCDCVCARMCTCNLEVLAVCVWRGVHVCVCWGGYTGWPPGAPLLPQTETVKGSLKQSCVQEGRMHSKNDKHMC